MEAWTSLLRIRRRKRVAERDAALERRAAQVVNEYLDAHAGILERAARLEEKAERLDQAGTPSESARNRAERAREEIVSGLSALRASFVEPVEGQDGAAALDVVAETLCPPFAPRWRRAAGAG